MAPKPTRPTVNEPSGKVCMALGYARMASSAWLVTLSATNHAEVTSYSDSPRIW